MQLTKLRAALILRVEVLPCARAGGMDGVVGKVDTIDCPLNIKEYKMPTVMITGADQGIGFHLAKRLLDDHMNVAVVDICLDHIGKLKERYGDALLLFQSDVRDAEGLSECASRIMEKFGGIDYAVHNACLCRFGNLEKQMEVDFREVLDVNLFGAIHLTRAVLPFMKRQRHGRIFFTSSGVGVMGFADLSAYACSKGAIETFAKCMNLECRENRISFHLFHPPLTRTASSSPLPVPDEFMADPETVGKGLAKNISQKRFIICHSIGQALQTRLMYWFPLLMGRFLDKMTRKAATEKEQRDK